MGQRKRLGEVLIKPELARHRASNLGDLEGMCQTSSVVVTFVKDEHLRLVLEAAECGRVNDPVAVPSERTAVPARWLRNLPSPALVRVAGVGGARGSHSNGHDDTVYNSSVAPFDSGPKRT